MISATQRDRVWDRARASYVAGGPLCRIRQDDLEFRGGYRDVRAVRYNVAVSDARSTLQVDKDQQVNAGTTVLTVSGELDLATISILKDAVGGQLGTGIRVVLDLSELTFCDSTGLGSFVALHRQATSVGATLALAAPRKRVADLLQISGINQVVSVFDTVGAATT
jgi:anti-sigma B factor antagonist